jgi:Tfp pilus assembly protein PilE
MNELRIPSPLWISGTRVRDKRRKSEAGDTLLEVLIAIVVIAIGVVALLGALTTSITSSATYRSLATLDTLLKSFSESVKYDVQLQPAATSLYQNCATSYQVVSEYPTTAVVGSGVTVFGTGFTGTSVPVTLGTSPPISLGTAPVQNGSVSTTFTVPSLPPGTTTVPILINSVPSATPLNVASTGVSSASPVAGYTVALNSIGWWNTSTAAFDNSTSATCSPNDDSGIQMITVQATAPNDVGDTLSFIVTDPAFQPVVIVSANPSSVASPSASSGIRFTASVTGSSGGGTPSGTINWVFNDIPGTPPQPQPCPNPIPLSSVGNTATATCTVTTVAAGSYQVTATYAPPSNGAAAGAYGPATGYASALAGTTPTATIQTTPPTPPSPMSTFTVTVTASGVSGQPLPSGAISWITSSPNLSCPGTPTLSRVPFTPTVTANTTCTASSPGAYQVTAVYPGDSNYLAATWPSASVTVG